MSRQKGLCRREKKDGEGVGGGGGGAGGEKEGGGRRKEGGWRRGLGSETNSVTNVAHCCVDVSLRPKRVVGGYNGAAAHQSAQVGVNPFIAEGPCAAVDEHHDAVARLRVTTAVIDVAEASRALGIAHVLVGARQLPASGGT